MYEKTAIYHRRDCSVRVKLIPLFAHGNGYKTCVHKLDIYLDEIAMQVYEKYQISYYASIILQCDILNN